MGSDGARGLQALRDAGFFTVAQNEDSPILTGRPGIRSSRAIQANTSGTAQRRRRDFEFESCLDRQHAEATHQIQPRNGKVRTGQCSSMIVYPTTLCHAYSKENGDHN